MAYELKKINNAIRENPADFLARCDLRYQQKIAAAADAIVENLDRSRIVLLSGPSGSGKTTTALKLEQELTCRGIHTHTVSLDNYFRTLTRENAPRTESGDVDYESPDYLDMQLLHQHFSLLEAGECVWVPKFEFTRQMRNDTAGYPLKLAKNEIAIYEGIHALNDRVAGSHDSAMRLYVSARSNVIDENTLAFKGTWMRLVRRCVRDHQFRGTGVDETMAMWGNVRRGEKLYISPFKHKAQIRLDSSLPYEVSVMKNFALPIFEEALHRLPAHTPRWDELHDLMVAFDQFEPLSADLLHPDALLREFIGGGSYSYK